MSNTPIDLGSASGFALATQGATSSALSLLGYDPNEWDIQEASYEDVVFHTFVVKSLFKDGLGAVNFTAKGWSDSGNWNGALSRISDAGGRRKAKFVFPYQDGQLLDDLGRAAESFSLDILLYGRDYKKTFERLFKKLQQPSPGKLLHPVRGEIRCGMISYELLHVAEARNSVAIRLTMEEANQDEMTFAKPKQLNSLQSAIANVAKSLNTITAIINKVQQAAMFYSGIRNMQVAMLTSYKETFGNSIQSVNKLFSATSSADLMNIRPVNAGTTYVGTLSPNDPFASTDLSKLSLETASAIAASAMGSQLDFLAQEANILTKTMATLNINSTAIDPRLAVLMGRNTDGTLQSETQTTISCEGATVYNTSPSALNEVPDGYGSLYFSEDIKALRDSVLEIRKAYDLGLQANGAKLIAYITPRLMSVREIAFELNVPFSRLNDIDALNPELDSLNYIPKGTKVMVVL
jgi:hypothetical protein